MEINILLKSQNLINYCNPFLDDSDQAQQIFFPSLLFSSRAENILGIDPRVAIHFFICSLNCRKISLALFS